MPRLLPIFFLLYAVCPLSAQMKPICLQPTDTNYFTGSMEEMVTADFNGDGFKDLAGVNTSYDSAYVYLNDKHGNLFYHSQYIAGWTASKILCTDFNNDQNPDLVILNGNNGTGSILLGTGNGSFQVDSTFYISSTVSDISASDLDGDGDPDFVISGGSEIHIFLNVNGVLQTPSVINKISSVRTVATGDFNGDGKPDIASSMWIKNWVDIYYGNGDGTFQSLVTNIQNTADSHTGEMIVADFNGDGIDDLITCDDVTSRLTLFKGNNTNTLSLAAVIGTISVALPVKQLAAGDVNNDQNIDLAIPNGQVFLGQGNGSFVAGSTYAGGDAYAVALDDLNNDNRLDRILGSLWVMDPIISTFMVGLSGPVFEVQGVNYLCNSPSVVVTATVQGNPSGLSFSWVNIVGQTIETSASLTATVPGIYFINVSKTNGCSNTKKIVVNACVGIDEENITGIRLWPNPVSERLHIEFGDDSTHQVYLYDTSGQLLIESVLISASVLDLRQLPPGIYFLRCGSDVKRLIKE